MYIMAILPWNLLGGKIMGVSGLVDMGVTIHLVVISRRGSTSN